MSSQGKTNFNHQMSFDVVSGPTGVDNIFTGCISHRIEDFEGPMVDSSLQIKGFGVTRTANVQMVTVVSKWHNNKGQTHKFKILKSFY